MPVRAHLLIKGRVQGVWFRANTQQQANILGLKGWVKNLSDGQVETIFEGEKTDVAVSCGVINTPERQYDVINRGITFYTSYNYVIEDNQPIKLENNLID